MIGEMPSCSFNICSSWLQVVQENQAGDSTDRVHLEGILWVLERLVSFASFKNDDLDEVKQRFKHYSQYLLEASTMIETKTLALEEEKASNKRLQQLVDTRDSQLKDIQKQLETVRPEAEKQPRNQSNFQEELKHAKV